MFLMTMEDSSFETNLKVIDTMWQMLEKDRGKEYFLKASDVKSKVPTEIRAIVNKAIVEKGIYRLRQLGLVEDWTVEDWMKGHYRIRISNPDDPASHAKRALQETIDRQDQIGDFDRYLQERLLPSLDAELRSRLQENTVYYWIAILLKWVEKRFLFRRRQQLYDVYDRCRKFNDPIAFRKDLEAFFSITQRSDLLEEAIKAERDNPEYMFDLFFALKDKTVLGEPGDGKFIDERSLPELYSQVSARIPDNPESQILPLLRAMLHTLIGEEPNDEFDKEARRAYGEWQRENPNLLDDWTEFLHKIPDKPRRKIAIWLAQKLLSSRESLRRLHEEFKDIDDVFAEYLAVAVEDIFKLNYQATASLGQFSAD
jgi:hypothetical protein